MRFSLNASGTFLVVSLGVIAAALGLEGAIPAAAGVRAGERSFEFVYAAEVHGLSPGGRTKVWLPVPPSDATQQIEQVDSRLPAGTAVNTEPRFGNRILSFELPADRQPFSVTYRVTRKLITLPLPDSPVRATATMSNAAALLQPDAHVAVGDPFDSALLAGRTIPADSRLTAKLLYDVVDDHLQYRKDKPGWGTGDAAWACQSGFGNCTDFHSLFISLARTEKLPSLFQIGFRIGDGPGGEVKGYHCWAWVKCDGGWIPVDIAEANQHPDRRAFYFGHLDGDRLAFSLGRDLNLVPRQAGPPLNFFVYPYAETDGKPVPPDRITMKFRYRSLP